MNGNRLKQELAESKLSFSNACINAEEQAVVLAERQYFYVFPCNYDKSPACPNGFKAATNDPKQVERLFRTYRGPLIGVVTGHLSGIAVLDVDVSEKQPHAGMDWLNAVGDQLPNTMEQETRRRGRHLIYRNKPGMRGTNGSIATGVDTRCEGGYIIWWQAWLSVPQLQTWQPFEFAPWPEVPCLQPRCATKEFHGKMISRVGDRNLSPASAHGRTYALTALADGSASVARSMEGQRNSTLNREAFKLTRFFAGGSLEQGEVVETLAGAAIQAGLSEDEIIDTLESAIADGIEAAGRRAG